MAAMEQRQRRYTLLTSITSNTPLATASVVWFNVLMVPRDNGHQPDEVLEEDLPLAMLAQTDLPAVKDVVVVHQGGSPVSRAGGEHRTGPTVSFGSRQSLSSPREIAATPTAARLVGEPVRPNDPTARA